MRVAGPTTDEGTRQNADPSPSGTRSVGRGSSAMLIAVAVMAIGGFVFNAVAARSVSTEVLGIHASLVFWILLINQLTSLGLPVTMSRLGRFPARATGDWVATWAFGLTVVSSLLGALLFELFGADTLRDEVHEALFRYGTLAGIGVMFAIVSGLSLTLLVEIRLVGIGLARLVVWRAVAANALRLALLGVVALRNDPLGLVAINLGSNALLGAVAAAWLIVRRNRMAAEQRPSHADIAAEARTAGVNWATIAAVQAPQFAVPVIAGLNADSNASFYLAWQIMTVVFLVPVVIGHVIVVESAGRGAASVRRVVMTGLALALAVTVVCATLSVPLGEFITELLFSESYRSAGSLLPPLMFASVPWSITAVMLATTRIDRRHGLNIAIALVFGVSTMVVALATTSQQATETAHGWLIANLVAAGLTLVVVAVFRATRRAPGWDTDAMDDAR